MMQNDGGRAGSALERTGAHNTNPTQFVIDVIVSRPHKLQVFVWCIQATKVGGALGDFQFALTRRFQAALL